MSSSVTASSSGSRRLQNALARFPAPVPPRQPASLLPPRRDRARYLSSPPAPAPAPCYAPRSVRWFGPAAQPAAWLPGRGTPRPALPAISVRTLPCAPRPRQCRRAISRLRLRSCCAARPARAATACAQSPCRARKAAPAESPSALIRAVIPLVVEASHPCGC